MSGSHGSVFTEPKEILICGLNWVGDSVMSMPALQLFSASLPSVRITMLVKPAVAALWNLHDDVYRVLTLERGPGGVFRAARFIRSQEFDRAYILPHSFRSALVPLLGRVKKRIGLPGHWRDFMLTDVLSPIGGPGRNHQCFEYIDLLCPDLSIHQPPKPTFRIRLPWHPKRSQTVRRVKY